MWNQCCPCRSESRKVVDKSCVLATRPILHIVVYIEIELALRHQKTVIIWAFFHRCQHCWPVCTAPIRLPSLTARSWLRRWRRCTRSPRCPTSTLPFTLSCCSSRSATKSVLDCFHHFKSEHLFDSFGIISLICSLGSDQLNWLILFHRARIWRAITVPIGFRTGSNLGWLGVSREFNLCAMPHTFWKTWPFSTGDGVRGWVSHGSLLQRLLPEVDEPGLGKLVKACPLPQPDLQGHEERPCAHQGPCVRQAFDAALHLLVKKLLVLGSLVQILSIQPEYFSPA